MRNLHALGKYSCIFLLFFSQHALADADGCEDVLKYAARDYTLETQANSIAKRIYDQSCSGSNLKEGSNLSIGLDAIVESIPFKFSLGGGSSKDKVETFCKTFDSELRTHSELYTEKNLVSNAAVQAWSLCVSLKNQGVEFVPIVATTLAAIQIKKKTPDPVNVNGIQYKSESMNCSVPNDDKSVGATVKASMDTRKTISNGDVWSVSCDRIPKSDGIYSQQDIIVHTSKGDFNLLIPADALIGAQSAITINEDIRKIAGRITNIEAIKTNIQCKTAENSSPVVQYPAISVEIPKNEEDWVVTGGGCETHMQCGHWPSVGYSGPTTKGWRCDGKDPPGIPCPFSITARVIYCKIKQ